MRIDQFSLQTGSNPVQVYTHAALDTQGQLGSLCIKATKRQKHNNVSVADNDE